MFIIITKNRCTNTFMAGLYINVNSKSWNADNGQTGFLLFFATGTVLGANCDMNFECQANTKTPRCTQFWSDVSVLCTLVQLWNG